MSKRPQSVSVLWQGCNRYLRNTAKVESVRLFGARVMDTYLPQPGPENGLPGYFLAPGQGIHYCNLFLG